MPHFVEGVMVIGGDTWDRCRLSNIGNFKHYLVLRVSIISVFIHLKKRKDEGR